VVLDSKNQINADYWEEHYGHADTVAKNFGKEME
jgi:hypothetical protein